MSVAWYTKELCKNDVAYLNFADRSSLVRETQFPSIVPLPTVGMIDPRHETYSAHANQCKLSPCKEKSGSQNT